MTDRFEIRYLDPERSYFGHGAGDMLGELDPHSREQLAKVL